MTYEVTITGKEDYEDGEVGCKECVPLRYSREVRQALEILRQFVQQRALGFIRILRINNILP